MELAAVMVNAVLPERYSNAEAEQLESVDGRAAPPPARPWPPRWPRTRARRSSARQIARLKRALDAPVITLPFLLTPEVDVDGLRELAAELERKL